jgi:hypothetical protein
MNLFKLISFIIAALLLIFFACKSNFQEKELRHPTLQMLPVPAGLGVNIHFFQGNENDLSLLKKAGVGIVRMDVSWNSIEKAAGQYGFSQHDQLISDLEQRNIRLLFIIDYGNPLYDDGLAPHSDDGRRAYVRFCSELAKRYVGKKIIWELWNEPNLDHFWKPKSHGTNYMKWCQAVVPAIRENDPEACIIAPATSSFDIPFMESCFKLGLLDLVDGISVHPYRNPSLGPETAAGEYRVLATLIEQYKPAGRDIPIISGEWGYSTSYLSDALQGKYLARQWVHNMGQDIPISIWYDWHDDGQDQDNAEHNFGTVEWDYQPKPAFLAMKTLTHQLQGYLPIGRISMAGVDDYVIPFVKEDQVILAVWTTAQPHEIDLGSDLPISQMVSHLGEQVRIPNGSILQIEDAPVYLQLNPPVPSWLKLIIDANQLEEADAAEVARSFMTGTSTVKMAVTLRKTMDQGTEIQRRAAFQSILQIAHKIRRDRSLALGLYHTVLRLDKDILNVKQALNTVANIGSLESLEVVAPLIKNPHFIQESSNYYLNVAFKLAGQKDFTRAEELLIQGAKVSPYRYSVQRVLVKLKEVGKEIDSRTQNVISRRAGFINQFWIVGPFPNNDDRAERTSFFPEKRIDFNQSFTYDTLTARWQKINLEGIYAIIPLANIFGKKQQAAYAYTELNMPVGRAVQFKIGSNDGVVCWLNGKKIHENLTARGLTVDEDVVQTSLKKGINRILLKIPNRGANWEACLRICDSNGVPLDLNDLLITRE